jgi:ATP-dependent Clp protease, protease subunit
MAREAACAQNEREAMSMSGSTTSHPEPSEKSGPSSLVRDHLFAARTVLVFGEVTTALAESVSAQLLALAARSSDPIRIVIHSPGGHVEAGDTLHDLIQFIEPPVLILGTGWVASAGALIFAAARLENRLALPNTRFMLHQPLGGVGGPASDVEIEVRQILAMRHRLNGIFARATGQTIEKIERDTERNHWMNAEEARAYGLVGSIIKSTAELAAKT